MITLLNEKEQMLALFSVATQVILFQLKIEMREIETKIFNLRQACDAIIFAEWMRLLKQLDAGFFFPLIGMKSGDSRFTELKDLETSQQKRAMQHFPIHHFAFLKTLDTAS